MSADFPIDRGELIGTVGDAIRSLLVAPPEGGAFIALIATVRAAAAYVDHTGATAYSPASIEAAVISAAYANDLELRNTLLEALRVSLGTP